MDTLNNSYIYKVYKNYIRQILKKSKAIKELKLWIKEISSRILESLRQESLTSEDISWLN